MDVLVRRLRRNVLLGVLGHVMLMMRGVMSMMSVMDALALVVRARDAGSQHHGSGSKCDSESGLHNLAPRGALRHSRRAALLLGEQSCLLDEHFRLPSIPFRKLP